MKKQGHILPFELFSIMLAILFASLHMRSLVRYLIAFGFFDLLVVGIITLFKSYTQLPLYTDKFNSRRKICFYAINVGAIFLALGLLFKMWQIELADYLSCAGAILLILGFAIWLILLYGKKQYLIPLNDKKNKYLNMRCRSI